MFFNPAELAPPANFANLLICEDYATAGATAEIRKLAEFAAPLVARNDIDTAVQVAKSQPLATAEISKLAELAAPAAAGALTPDDLAIAHALLRGWGEDDPHIRRDWLDSLRDPAILDGMRQMALDAGVARYETPPAPATEPEDEPRPMAVCARCRHWTPDTINPPGGLGRCLIDAPRSRKPGSCWPWTHDEAGIYCNQFEETAHE